MKQRDPSEPSRLLEDLESIRTLLDEHPEPEIGDDGQLETLQTLQDVAKRCKTLQSMLAP